MLLLPLRNKYFGCSKIFHVKYEKGWLGKLTDLLECDTIGDENIEDLDYLRDYLKVHGSLDVNFIDPEMNYKELKIPLDYTENVRRQIDVRLVEILKRVRNEIVSKISVQKTNEMMKKFAKNLRKYVKKLVCSIVDDILPLNLLNYFHTIAEKKGVKNQNIYSILLKLFTDVTTDFLIFAEKHYKGPSNQERFGSVNIVEDDSLELFVKSYYDKRDHLKKYIDSEDCIKSLLEGERIVITSHSGLFSNTTSVLDIPQNSQNDDQDVLISECLKMMKGKSPVVSRWLKNPEILSLLNVKKSKFTGKRIHLPKYVPVESNKDLCAFFDELSLKQLNSVLKSDPSVFDYSMVKKHTPISNHFSISKSHHTFREKKKMLIKNLLNIDIISDYVNYVLENQFGLASRLRDGDVEICAIENESMKRIDPLHLAETLRDFDESEHLSRFKSNDIIYTCFCVLKFDNCVLKIYTMRSLLEKNKFKKK